VGSELLSKNEINFWISENEAPIIFFSASLFLSLLFLSTNVNRSTMNVSATFDSRSYNATWEGNKEITFALLRSGSLVKFYGAPKGLKSSDDLCLLQEISVLGAVYYGFQKIGECT